VSDRSAIHAVSPISLAIRDIPNVHRIGQYRRELILKDVPQGFKCPWLSSLHAQDDSQPIREVEQPRLVVGPAVCHIG
jgi:hypothetical protein